MIMHGTQTNERMLMDLAASGLVPEDVSARLLGNPERAAAVLSHDTTGYVLPYYGPDGKLQPFYRIRLFDQDIKYKQPKNTANYVYYPKNFQAALEKNPSFVIITEGEKKAALACKLGYPCVGLGGVDSWRNRVIAIPKDAELNQQKTKIHARIPSGHETTEDYTSPLALGMQELIDLALYHRMTIVICFDADPLGHVNADVQRAASTLGFELRFKGISFEKIKQLIIPAENQKSKVGLDDYLMQSPEKFKEQLLYILRRKSAFPEHPSVRDFLNKRLQSSKISRKELQSVAMAVLSILDNRGLRLFNRNENQPYYFHFLSRKLMKADFPLNNRESPNNEFTNFLYREFGLSSADNRIMPWLAAQFSGEDPVEQVTPHRVLARVSTADDCIHYQISDGQFVTINGLPNTNPETPQLPGFELRSNGDLGILFEAGQVVPLNPKKLIAEYATQAQLPNIQPWWIETLDNVRLRDSEKLKIVAALLFYMSPWLQRWRGLQLPAEMFLGEASSGKSTLYDLRLTIINGESRLRNAPQDMKDWYASVTSTGGLHVTDNVQLADKSLRQRLSDEICRIITEPNPYVEMRKYYTNADLIRIPVSCVFGVSAIQQPFLNADIIQRSIIIEFSKAAEVLAGSLTYNSEWMPQQLNRVGGREAWVAHHLLVLHHFFRIAKEMWQPNYRAKYRLVHFEQAMIVMASVFGLDASWIPDFLNKVTGKAISEADWAFEGLQAYASWLRSRGVKPGFTFKCQDITNWAEGTEDFNKCDVLVNARKLGRYMVTHQAMIADATGIVHAGQTNNSQRFKVLPQKSS